MHEARAVSTALRRLRLKAGYESLRATEEAVRTATGETVSRSAISKWERGAAAPGIDITIVYLRGLGFSLFDLQHEIETILRQEKNDDPATIIAAQLESNPATRASLRAFLAKDPDAADLLTQLDQLDSATDSDNATDTDNANGSDNGKG